MNGKNIGFIKDLYTQLVIVYQMLLFVGILIILDIIIPESIYTNFVDNIRIFRIGAYMVTIMMIFELSIFIYKIKKKIN